MEADPTIFVVDDDPGALKSLQWLIQSANWPVQAFQSAREFLEFYHPNVPGCLVLDVRMPEMTGLELQQEMDAKGWTIPVIFVTGYATVSSCVQALKSGAFDFVEKPATDSLLEQIRRAIQLDARNRLTRQRNLDTEHRLKRLTVRERQVMELLVNGKRTKQIAKYLGVGAQTAAKHRTKVLEKMSVENEVELVYLVVAQKSPPRPCELV